MHLKYIISRDGPEKNLIIREYATTEKKVKKPTSSMSQFEKFTILSEETYESKKIIKFMSFGTKTLVSILRTRNLYPIEPYATKIAETVLTLYSSNENRPVELFFNDVDLVSVDAGAV